jgi:DNA invertase Pin-like site-specific DNA recombinase
MLIGYARVSTTDQELSGQVDSLEKAGCERIFLEKLTGKTVHGRTELHACLAALGKGDVLVVTKLDRIARSVRDLASIIGDLVDRGVGFRCLHQGGVDVDSLTGRLMLHILGAVAEFEVGLIAERRAEGIARAKLAGKYKGGTVRHPVAAMRRAAMLGVDAAGVMERFAVSRATAYRVCGDIWRSREQAA